MKVFLNTKGVLINVLMKGTSYTGNININMNEISFSVDSNENKKILLVTENKSFFESTYNIYTYYKNRNSFILEAASLIRGHWRISAKDFLYDIYLHKKGKCSVFKNNKQISAISRNKISVFQNNEFYLTIDDCEDAWLIIGVCLSLYVKVNYIENNASLNINLGNLVFEKRTFDESWQPN